MATSVVQCRFCEHSNPSDASFCNRCGAQLNFAPCAHCGAVNDSSAGACFQCGQPLGTAILGAAPSDHCAAPSPSVASDHRFELIDEMLATSGSAMATSGSAMATAATPGEPRYPRRRARFILVLGGISLGALVLGIYAVRREPVEPAPTAALDPDAVPGTRSISGADPALTPPGAGPARPIAKSAGDTSTSGAPAAAGRMATQNCTEGVAALGLCTETRKSTSSPATARSPAAPAAAKNVATPPSTAAAAPCTEARAALGLCVMTTTTRKQE